MSVILETSVGNITVDLYLDERPRCCLNFLKLCKIKYYNFILFHNVQKNLVAQTGDPTSTGRGGESVFGHLYGDQARYFEMETNPRIKHLKAGLVSMVNNGDNLHGSQFFITLADSVDYLDGKHTVFGEVAEGMDVVKVINEAYCDKQHRPYKDIRINHTIILDDPYDDPAGLEIPDRSPRPTKEQLSSSRIGADEEIDDTKGLTNEEITEMIETREANANMQILEMVGDLPNVNVKPPDNILFVCKLNPVTTADDLEIIFSRFGNIISCEVIKDKKSGESLQYAFVEFEKDADCEAAYFKMDNVLIDDRRIHVDFSQSVSKLNWGDKWTNFKQGKLGESSQQDYAIRDFSRKDNRYDIVLPHDDQDDHKSRRHRSRSASRDKQKSKREHKEYKKSKDRSDTHQKHGTRDGKQTKSHKSQSHDHESSRKRHKHKHRDSS